MQRAKRSASGVFKGHGKAVYFRGMSFNKRAACGFIAAYALASVALLLYTVVTYQALGASVQVQVARVGGAQLNLHTLLLLLSMCQSLHLFIASRYDSCTPSHGTSLIDPVPSVTGRCC